MLSHLWRIYLCGEACIHLHVMCKKEYSENSSTERHASMNVCALMTRTEHTHVRTQTSTQTYIHTYIHTYTCMHANHTCRCYIHTSHTHIACTHTYIHTYMDTWIHSYHACIKTYVCTYLPACIMNKYAWKAIQRYAQISIIFWYIHVYVHMHTNKHTHTHSVNTNTHIVHVRSVNKGKWQGLIKCYYHHGFKSTCADNYMIKKRYARHHECAHHARASSSYVPKQQQ
jgi:hypothetical protein